MNEMCGIRCTTSPLPQHTQETVRKIALKSVVHARTKPGRYPQLVPQDLAIGSYEPSPDNHDHRVQIDGLILKQLEEMKKCEEC